MEANTMIRTCAALFTVMLSFTPVATCFADESTEARRLARTTLEAAKAGLNNERTVFRVRELFWWSQRVLFAELELAENPRARMDAFKAHASRCKEFEDKINRLTRNGELTNQYGLEAHYFRVRADYWLAQEKLAQSRGKTAAPVSTDTFDRR
jgi:hypothetical protein